MRTTLLTRMLGQASWLVLLWPSATIHAKLPAAVAINEGAGRGDLLIVPVRMERGDELPFVVDTGSSGTLLDESLERKLGKRVGTLSMQGWGKTTERPMYAAPPLYLGGARLITGSNIVTVDFKTFPSAGGRPIMGILGIDCLKHYCIQLDFEAGKMRFLKPDGINGARLGKAYPITYDEGRPWVLHNGLVEGAGAYTLVDTGYQTDGAVQDLSFENTYVSERVWEGRRYTELVLGNGGYVLGLRFLARHLVTLDFPSGVMYLRQQSAGPLPGDMVPFFKTTRVEALEPLIKAVLQENAGAARSELVAIEQGGAAERTKVVAKKLAATLGNEPKPTPDSVPPQVTQLALGDAKPTIAQVGWLQPAANRIPPSKEIHSPLLDSGRVYATGLYAHSPSRYVFQLSGRWRKLRGEAGLHTAFQPYAFGVVFVIKTDGKEVFRSSIIRGTAKPKYEIDLTAVKTLELLVEQATDRNGGNWALWLDPTLFRDGKAPGNDARSL